MGKMILKDAFLSINGKDLSDHLEQIDLNYSAVIHEKGAMGEESITRIAGLKDFKLSATLLQDYDAASVDATLFPLIGAASFPVVVRPKKAVKSATNPEFTGNALLASYPPISGTHGQVAKASISLEGDGDLLRTPA